MIMTLAGRPAQTSSSRSRQISYPLLRSTHLHIDPDADYVDVPKLRLRRETAPPRGVDDVTWVWREGKIEVLVPDWATTVVREVTPARGLYAARMEAVLARLSYWQMPKADGEPRTAEAFRGSRYGVLWFATSASHLARVFGWSTPAAERSLDGLARFGLIERLAGRAVSHTAGVTFHPDTAYTRIAWEVVNYLLPPPMPKQQGWVTSDDLPHMEVPEDILYTERLAVEAAMRPGK